MWTADGDFDAGRALDWTASRIGLWELMTNGVFILRTRVAAAAWADCGTASEGLHGE